jgi:small subunit ribosomal protein S18
LSLKISSAGRKSAGRPAEHSIVSCARRSRATRREKEETLCLKKLKSRRPSRAHLPASESGPDPGWRRLLARLRLRRPGVPRWSRWPAGGGPGGRGKFFRRKKVCKFCTEKIDAIPYRDVRLLQGFVAERGKIVPRRLTGVCTTHQRRLTRAIKQARNIALLPFATRH